MKMGATDLPYAAEAESSLSPDELEVSEIIVFDRMTASESIRVWSCARENTWTKRTGDWSLRLSGVWQWKTWRRFGVYHGIAMGREDVTSMGMCVFVDGSAYKVVYWRFSLCPGLIGKCQAASPFIRAADYSMTQIIYFPSGRIPFL